MDQQTPSTCCWSGSRQAARPACLQAALQAMWATLLWAPRVPIIPASSRLVAGGVGCNHHHPSWMTGPLAPHRTPPLVMVSPAEGHQPSGIG